MRPLIALNPDEMETQILPGPLRLPDGEAPTCLKFLLASIQAQPPDVDPYMQVKANFKMLVQSSQKGANPAGSLSGLCK